MSQGINYSHLEIAIEVAWQIGDSLKNSPSAYSSDRDRAFQIHRDR